MATTLLRSAAPKASCSASPACGSRRSVSAYRLPITNPSKLEAKRSTTALLLKDDARLGRKGDIIAVSRFHLDKHLVPSGVATPLVTAGTSPNPIVPHPSAPTIRSTFHSPSSRSDLASSFPVLSSYRPPPAYVPSPYGPARPVKQPLPHVFEKGRLPYPWEVNAQKLQGEKIRKDIREKYERRLSAEREAREVDEAVREMDEADQAAGR